MLADHEFHDIHRSEPSKKFDLSEELTPKRLDELERIVRQASYGPWELEGKLVVSTATGREIAHAREPNNGRFIEAFDPHMALALIETLREAWQELGRIKSPNTTVVRSRDQLEEIKRVIKALPPDRTRIIKTVPGEKITQLRALVYRLSFHANVRVSTRVKRDGLEVRRVVEKERLSNGRSYA